MAIIGHPASSAHETVAGFRSPGRCHRNALNDEKPACHLKFECCRGSLNLFYHGTQRTEVVEL